MEKGYKKMEKYEEEKKMEKRWQEMVKVGKNTLKESKRWKKIWEKMAKRWKRMEKDGKS